MLGADGPSKAEATVAACALFCDEWEPASHGGELTGADAPVCAAVKAQTVAL